MTQDKIDAINSLIKFCHIPRKRGECADGIGVSRASISQYIKAAPECFKLDYQAEKVNGSDTMSILGIKPFDEEPTRNYKNTGKVYTPEFVLREPELPNIALWGFTDYAPPFSADRLRDCTEQDIPLRPMPKNAVSGNTLSMLG